jgi:hypothetical protein
VGGADIGADDPLQVDLHGAFAKAFAERIGSLGDEPFVEIAGPVAVDHRGPEAFGDPDRLGTVRAGEADHFDGGALAELHDPGGLARIGYGLGHVFSFRPEAVPALCRLALRCGRPEPAEDGRFKVRARPVRAEPICERAGHKPCDVERSCSAQDGGSGRPAA